MPDSKVTLEEICEEWRREQREVGTSHLPTSTLFDFMQQSLSDMEKSLAFQHLAECPACLQDFNAMMRIRDAVLMVKRPLAATADSPS
jgi:hypothetical protein